MVRGFFADSELISTAPTALLPRCGSCQLYTKCQTPKMPVQGKGKKKILIVGRPPNAAEDSKGRFAGGKSGSDLIRALSRYGIDLFEDCWIMGALACWAGRREIPTPEQIEHCQPTVLNFIKKAQPELILLFGPEALTSVLRDAYKRGSYDIKTYAGFCIPSRKYNAWICPLDHPDFIFNSEKNNNQRVSLIFWEKRLKEALQRKGRPYAHPPEQLESKIQRIYDSREAAKRLIEYRKKGGEIAFDYETNCLKPEWPEAKIISASVCYEGEETIAFPFDGPAVEALARLLKSSCPKIAANLKFEDRWTKKILGVQVRNWAWDTMLAAHWLDCREGITGLKVQAFLQLGIPAFNTKVEDYLKSVDGSPYNRVDQIGLDDLLTYNGLDSLIEFEIAKIQQRKLRSL
jgi:uracil-DNA glycosylase family 4